ncbi:MAG: exodeoxyribonuclease IX [Pseudomonadota bacterium]|nr:MAG: exodeoxyribonuclease IX [Pseudomonadota bacterium]
MTAHAARPDRPTYLVDASVYVFRAWHSLPAAFADPAGRPTNAVYGYARFLCELLERTGATDIAVAFDESLTRSFRNEIYPDYKANREPAPDALKQQFSWCQDLTRALGISVWSDARHEADDFIATLAAGCRRRASRICVISGDKDLTQLIGDGDHWWDFPRRRLDGAGVQARFGVRPEQMADFLALTGDSIDNIPGVPGVGPKTAAALLQHFGDLDALYRRLDEIAWLSIRGASKLAQRLRQHESAARLARRLTGLKSDVPMASQVNRLARQRTDHDAVNALMDRLGFGRPMRERLLGIPQRP